MNAAQARESFATARVARLATVGADGRPHLVPIVFALVDEGLCFAVDAKPKSGAPLRRLANITANPAVSVLVDHYDEDWNQLWWARADGRAAILAADADEADRPLAALTARYPQYRAMPPPGPTVVITVDHWTGWAYA